MREMRRARILAGSANRRKRFLAAESEYRKSARKSVIRRAVRLPGSRQKFFLAQRIRTRARQFPVAPRRRSPVAKRRPPGARYFHLGSRDLSRSRRLRLQRHFRFLPLVAPPAAELKRRPANR